MQINFVTIFENISDLGVKNVFRYMLQKSWFVGRAIVNVVPRHQARLPWSTDFGISKLKVKVTEFIY